MAKSLVVTLATVAMCVEILQSVPPRAQLTCGLARARLKSYAFLQRCNAGCVDGLRPVKYFLVSCSLCLVFVVYLHSDIMVDIWILPLTGLVDVTISRTIFVIRHSVPSFYTA